MADSKSMELTLWASFPRSVSGVQRSAPVRTALTEHARGGALSVVLCLRPRPGSGRAESLCRTLERRIGPRLYRAGPTDIVNKALDEAEQTGDPRIEFELELVPDQVVQEPDRSGGTVTVVGWDEVEGGDMGD